MTNQNILDLLNLLVEAVNKLPAHIREDTLAEINSIKEIIVDTRPPKIIVIGRRGAGKSSLINAIFNQPVAKVGSVVSETGAAEWHDFTSSKKGTLRILDTRGIGDRTIPESANFENSIDEIKDAIDKDRPDAMLFLCKAKEADAHVSEDIRNLVLIKDYVNKKYNYNLPVAAVVTQIDELDPKRIEPPYHNETKQKNINKAVDSIAEAMKSGGVDLIKIIPVSTYIEFDEGERYDNYYNIEILVEYLMDVLPKSAQLQMARLSSVKEIQKKFADVLIGSTATLCGAIAAVPIPVADLIPITAAQITMIVGIGYLSGRDLSKESAKEFLVAAGINTGVGFALREVARASIKFLFPGGGSVISATVAFGSTWGIGKMAVAYFIEEKAMKDAKEIYEKSKKEAENTFKKDA